MAEHNIKEDMVSRITRVALLVFFSQIANHVAYIGDYRVSDVWIRFLQQQTRSQPSSFHFVEDK